MGYTHYWRREIGTGTPEQFAELSRMVSNIRELGAGTVDEFNSESRIGFNGNTLKHETFIWSEIAKDDFDFCKTAQKPYDEVVTASLLAVASVYGDSVKISSDGSKAEWQSGIKLFEEATRRTAPVEKIKFS